MLRKRFAALTAASAVLLGTPTFASYDANMTGVVADVLVYSDSNVILFRLVNQPASHPSCIASLFALDSAIPAATLDRLYARLLAAKTTGEAVNIGYDSQGNCAHTYIRVHRIG